MTAVSNTLDSIMPKILARSLVTLRQRVIMPRLVNNDYSKDAAKKGDVINVSIPAPRTAYDVVPSHENLAPTSAAPANVQIPLNNWKGSNFGLTDDDLNKIDKDESFVPGEMNECLKAIANACNISIWGEYKGVYGIAGKAGTTPFKNVGTAEEANPEDGTRPARDAREVLNTQLCDREGRVGVLNFAAESKALALPAFRDASQSGKDAVVKKGELGEFFGVDWHSDDHVPTHASTALTAGACTINGVNAVNAGSSDNGRTGTISIAKATNTSPLVKGDIIEFTVGGVVQQHVVTADTTLIVGNTSVPVAPALRVATAGAEAVTLRATHVVNLMFNPMAIAFATRSFQGESKMLSDEIGGSKTVAMQDKKSGLVLRLEVTRQRKQFLWELDMLWGVKLVRPEFACRIAG